MKKITKPLLFLFMAILLLSSCQTAEPTVEYVTVDYDWDGILEPILEMKPERVKLIDPPETLSDIMQNSVSFQHAYTAWKNYAGVLEELYRQLANQTSSLN